MPLPNFTHLQANPELILPWLENNLLLAGNVVNVLNPPGTSNVTIALAPPHPVSGLSVAVKASGVPIDVYTINNNVPAGANTLPSYICNYTANNRNSVLLGHLGDYCFTITLNGCSFGIGPNNPNHTRLVSHVNSGGNVPLQRQQLQLAHGVGPNMAGLTVLEPALYRRFGPGLNMQATVFGIRTGHNWRFYFQSYSAHGQGTYRMYGVFPII